MSEPEQGEKERNRQIAQNESARGAVSAVRLSSWAIGIAVILGLIALGLASPWLGR
jgi:anti-sigma factor RsiW